MLLGMSAIGLPGHDIMGIRAANPGSYTLSGTNSWIVGRDPGWLIDPGPALPEHVENLRAELQRRGGLGGIALTHDHADHAEAVAPVCALFPDAPLAAARGAADVRLQDGMEFGPLKVLQTPGHAPDHLAFLKGTVGFSGDAVLGEGSVFIAPDPGALAGYLQALGALRRLGLELLCPGHGPPVDDVDARLEQYLTHRLERERRLLQALAGGSRTADELLQAVWSDAPQALRPAAAMTLAAHLDKLQQEGRLPPGVERPMAA